MTKAIALKKEQQAVFAVIALRGAGHEMTYDSIKQAVQDASGMTGPIDMEDVMTRFPEVKRVAPGVYQLVESDKPKALNTVEMIRAMAYGDVYECVGGGNAFVGMKARKGRSGIMWITGFMAGELLQMGEAILSLVWVKE